jgi:hypothetical protein
MKGALHMAVDGNYALVVLAVVAITAIAAMNGKMGNLGWISKCAAALSRLSTAFLSRRK